MEGDDIVLFPKLGILRDLALKDGLAAYQLVGEVTAHQGVDG